MSSLPGRKTGEVKEEEEGSVYALPREGRSKGGSTGAPVKSPVLGFHSLNQGSCTIFEVKFKAF